MEFDFIAGRPSLDFVATVSERGTTDLELLNRPADLQEWISLADVVDTRVQVSDAGLDEATRAREALYTVLRAAAADRPVPKRHRDLVNGYATTAPPVPVLTAAGRVRRDGDLPSVLALLARDALDLLAGPDRDLLRWCADDTCTRPFVDRSRGHRRRWCGMRGCGDRAKAAAYRRRQRPSA